MLIRGRCNKNLRRRANINYSNIVLKHTALIIGIFRQTTNTVFICLLKFGIGALTFNALAHGAVPGMYLYNLSIRRSKIKKYFLPGGHVMVKLLSFKTVFSQIRGKQKKFAQYIRAAGTYTSTYQRYNDAEVLSCLLPTGKIKVLSFFDVVLLGRNSNIYHRRQIFGKAGINISVGFKSKVRGVAMNPVDHPHGGRTKTNCPEVSPWGWVAKKNK